MLSCFRGPALLALACIALAGCSSLGKTIDAVNGLIITQGQIDGARSSYIALFLTPAAHYRCASIDGGKCTPRQICRAGQSFLRDQCATRDAITKIQSTTVALSKGLGDLQAQFNAGNNTGIYAAYSAVQTAITAAAGLVATYEGN